jgi:hypothetical protein
MLGRMAAPRPFDKEEFLAKYGQVSGSLPQPGETRGEVPFEESRARQAFERNLSRAPAPPDNPAQRIIARLLAVRLKATGGEGSLFGVLDDLQANIDELLPIARWLAAQGFATIVAQPRNGDWTLKLTPKGDAELTGPR